MLFVRFGPKASLHGMPRCAGDGGEVAAARRDRDPRLRAVVDHPAEVVERRRDDGDGQDVLHRRRHHVLAARDAGLVGHEARVDQPHQDDGEEVELLGEDRAVPRRAAPRSRRPWPARRWLPASGSSSVGARCERRAADVRVLSLNQFVGQWTNSSTFSRPNVWLRHTTATRGRRDGGAEEHMRELTLDGLLDAFAARTPAPGGGAGAGVAAALGAALAEMGARFAGLEEDARRAAELRALALRAGRGATRRATRQCSRRCACRADAPGRAERVRAALSAAADVPLGDGRGRGRGGRASRAASRRRAARRSPGTRSAGAELAAAAARAAARLVAIDLEHAPGDPRRARAEAAAAAAARRLTARPRSGTIRAAAVPARTSASPAPAGRSPGGKGRRTSRAGLVLVDGVRLAGAGDREAGPREAIMTRQADFKRRVRDRMARTGESYAAARGARPREPSGRAGGLAARAARDQRRRDRARAARHGSGASVICRGATSCTRAPCPTCPTRSCGASAPPSSPASGAADLGTRAPSWRGATGRWRRAPRRRVRAVVRGRSLRPAAARPDPRPARRARGRTRAGSR